MRIPLIGLVAALAVALGGCGVAPEPEGAPAPPSPPEPTSQIVSGSADSVGAVPGSANSMYMFRFRQLEPPGQFNFRDRELSFYLRPSPTALYFKVENLQGRPVDILWDESTFEDVNGRIGKVAHSTTRWRDRYSPLVRTTVPGQSQYGDYTFPIDYLVDPGTATNDDQPHQPLVPEDSSAPTYSGRSFALTLSMRVEDRPRTYTFRFQIQSVIPR